MKKPKTTKKKVKEQPLKVNMTFEQLVQISVTENTPLSKDKQLNNK